MNLLRPFILSVRLHHLMEGLCLATVLLVPLVFLPPDIATSSTQIPKIVVFRTFFSLMLIVWILELVLNPSETWARIRFLWRDPVGDDIFGGTRRVMFGTAILFLACNFLSLVMSPSWGTSLWGKSPASDGYAVYTMTAYILFSLTIATHFRTSSQIRRLLVAITIVGVLVGGHAVLQRFGLDPFAEGLAGIGSDASLGNPIFAGQVLVVSIGVTLGLMAASVLRHRDIRSVVTWGFVIGLQLSGLIFTFSQGAWVSLLIVGILFVCIGLIKFGLRECRYLLLPLFLAFGITLVLVTLPGRAEEGSGENFGLSAVTERALRSPASADGLGGRFQVWRGSVDLIWGAEWFKFGSDQFSSVRPLFGYGPEMFGTVFPLKSPPELHVSQPGTFFYAHNHYIHLMVETGVVGVCLFLAMLSCVWLVAIRALRKVDESHAGAIDAWIVIGGMSAIGGWMVAITPGIPRVSDMVVIWALIGAIFSVPRLITSGSGDTEVRGDAGHLGVSRTVATPQLRLESFGRPAFVLRGVMALLVIISLMVATWGYNGDYAAASIKAGRALNALESGDGIEGALRLDEAIQLAPDVPSYYLLRGALSTARSMQAPSDNLRLAFAHRAHADNSRAQGLTEYSPQNSEALARSASRLGSLGEEAFTAEAILWAERLADLMPYHFKVREFFAHILWVSGDSERAMVQIESAIEFAGQTSEAARSHFIQGILYNDLGQPSKAAQAVSTALILGLESSADEIEAHRFLVSLYEFLGDEVRAAQHRSAYNLLLQD